MMHIFFAEESTAHSVPSVQPPIPQSIMSRHSTAKKKGDLQPSSTGKTTNFVALFNEFIRKHSSGVSLAVVVAVHKTRQPAESSEKQNPSEGEANNGSDTKWKPLYVSSSLKATLKTTNNRLDERYGTGWPLNHWAQIHELVDIHCSSTPTSDPVKYTIESVIAGDISGANQSPSRREYCHLSSISDSLCLVVIHGAGSAKWQNSSDNAIQHFLRCTVPKLCVENLLSLDVVIRLKSELYAENDSKHQRRSDHVQSITLWSESGWSASQQNQSLGLRRKHSPVIEPLRSPYVKRQIRKLGREGQRRKSNRGHFDFFLGSDIGQLL